MIGDVWEWTTSDYVPYPGFKSEFDEYNDKWFVNQKVLRGGSFATPQISHSLDLPELLSSARTLDDLRISVCEDDLTSEIVMIRDGSNFNVCSTQVRRIDNKIAHSVEFKSRGPIAQLVEQLTLNQRVAGSSPARLI